jgi:hypothetical protein
MERLRVGLRLLLLIVALFAVVFAWIGAQRDLHRINLRGQIRGHEIQRDYAAGRMNDPEEGAHWKNAKLQAESNIASLRLQLGETDHEKNR